MKNDEHTPLEGSLTTILTSAYKEMLAVLQLSAVRGLALVLITCRAALGVFGQATYLQIVGAGMPKEHLALLSSVAMAFGMAAQIFVSGRYLTGKDSEVCGASLSVRSHAPRRRGDPETLSP